MSSREKQELQQQREEALARRMGQALDQADSHNAGDNCPEAHVLAAYYERALGSEETASCEGHFAGCSRCRSILAVLAASASMTAPLAEAEIARLGAVAKSAARMTPTSDHAASGKITPIRTRGWDWRSRWLAPALGVAAVLAVWFAIRPPWRASQSESSGTLVAQAPRNEVPPSDQPSEADRMSQVTREQNRKQTGGSTGNQPTSNSQSFNSPAQRSAEVDNSVGNVSPDAEARTDTLQNETQKDKTIGRLPSEAKSAPPPAPPPPAPRAANTDSQAHRAEAAAGAQTSGGVFGRAALRDKDAPEPQQASGAMVAPQASPRAAMSARTSQNLSEFKATTDTPFLVRAPSGLALWRAGKGGSIEHSTDAGHTYTSQASPSHEDWITADAVSDTIAWLAGRAGAIARTTDGEHWERVAPPSPAADSAARFPDWTSITARDAMNATITARDGRRFATQDGGKTWQTF